MCQFEEPPTEPAWDARVFVTTYCQLLAGDIWLGNHQAYFLWTGEKLIPIPKSLAGELILTVAI